MQAGEERMNQSTSHDDVSSELRAKRKRISHSMKRKFSRDKMKVQRGNSERKIAQLIKEAHNDDSSNSENSDGSPLYNEINWEENIACDSTLVDEFAPRIQPAQPKQIKPSTSDMTRETPPPPPSSEPTPSFPEELGNNVSEELELEEGAEIFVRVNLTNDNPQWLAATVVEVDHEEEELLIKYAEGNPPPPMEWMKPTSNRISRTKPSLAQIEQKMGTLLEQKVAEEGVVGENKPPSIADTISQSSVSVDGTPPPPEVTAPAVVAPSLTPGQPGPTPAPPTPTADPPAHPSSKRRKKHFLVPQTNYTGTSKFAVGEKVLAKWSDHRMQKFPAVIKTIVSGGKYDVLFYDGFEKTINEEHLFKTTEEEIAKYQHMNPSEADSFVHMDLDSKEARRMRKKKTFDDYVFARDFKVKRRSMKSTDRFNMPRKMAYFAKGSVGGEASGVGEADKPLRQRKMKKRRRSLFSPKKDKYKMLGMEPPMASSPHSMSSSNHSATQESSSQENFYGFDSEPSTEMTPVTPKTEPIEEKPVTIKTEVVDPPAPVVIKREPTEDRWKPRDDREYRPIDINRDGVIRKSLAVPDNNLLPGWSKHAVVSTTNNLWDVILLSPDGYQINNQTELREYFELKMNGPAPPTLDFAADFNVLAELASKQKEREPPVPPSPTPRIWRRGGRGNRRGGRVPGTRGRPPGVRTLLPKYRFEDHPPVSTPPHTPATIPENEFRCPKEGCDKKFRKESLLQMHIKHYHRELSSLVQYAPNMVDLANARLESVNSDWKTTSDLPKIPPYTVKKLLPRSFSSSPNVPEDPAIKTEPGLETPTSSVPSTSRHPERTSSSETPLMKRPVTEERRSTIKTILPIRSSEAPHKGGVDSDDIESEDEYIEQKKNGSRIFKPGKFKRGSRFLAAFKGEGNLGENSSQLPAFKFTKKRKNEKAHSSDSYDAYPEEEKLSSGVEMTEDGVVIERLKSEEFINCVCGFREEDGLMIQCDICMCWQHGLCSGIENESDVPERYVCTICRNPFRVRPSKKYSFAQHYLTQGKLPTFNFRVRNDDDIAHREMILKRSFELSASVLEIKNVDRSLAAKINIAEKADHPKLYMWAKNWEEPEAKLNGKVNKDQDGNNGDNPPDIANQPPVGPQPEAPIDLEECRIRLLDHVEHCYSQIEDRLTSLQTQIAALESLDPDLSSSTASDKVTKQTIHMLIRDLETLNKFAAISS